MPLTDRFLTVFRPYAKSNEFWLSVFPLWPYNTNVSLREADELGVSALASRTEGLESKPQDIKGPGLSELDEDAAFEDINWVIGADRSAINVANYLCLLPLL